MEHAIAVADTGHDDQLRERIFSWLGSLHDPLIPRKRVNELLEELWALFLEYRHLEHLRDKNRFAIADRILELERLVGEVAYQFIDTIAEHFGYNETLLRQHLRVAQLFPPHVRKPNLRFSYYRMIAEIHLGTKEFAERQARAWQLLEVVAAHADAGAITSRYDDVKRLIRMELQARGWLQPALTASSDDVIDVSYQVMQQTEQPVPRPAREPAAPTLTEPSMPPTLLAPLNLRNQRYIVRYTVQYGMDGYAEATVVCNGTEAFIKTMESLVALSEIVAHQNGLLTERYLDSDDPIPGEVFRQLSPAARRLLTSEEP